ncbi:hypothetical protein AKO1_006133, partial [Acrasis kona]
MELHYMHKKLVNQVITTNMNSKKIEAYSRFALLWGLVGETGQKHRLFDDGLFLMMDSIKSEQTGLKLVGKSWLLSSMNDINRVLDPLLDTLIDRENLQQVQYESSNSTLAVTKNIIVNDVPNKTQTVVEEHEQEDDEDEEDEEEELDESQITDGQDQEQAQEEESTIVTDPNQTATTTTQQETNNNEQVEESITTSPSTIDESQ